MGSFLARTLTSRLLLMGAVALLWAFPVSAQEAPPPYSRQSPLWLDFDMQSVPQPESWPVGYAYDFANGTVFQQVKGLFDVTRLGAPQEAYNVNTLDEVPDSSWFTNRNSRRTMTLEEVRRGPDTNDGPVEGVLTVTRGKTEGLQPGFWIKDERGDTYIVKFDPPDNPELATTAEVVSTKLFYAIGYNVPQNTIFYLHPDQLRLANDAEFTDILGNERPMTAEDLRDILSQAARRPDGRYRAVASRLLPGKPIGGFHFLGLRKDDPNDIIPHEHRRDVRALRVFSAWLEHNDIRAGNTLDLYVEEDARRFVRHYLIDFGSTLGSETIGPDTPVVGHENILDWSESGKSLFTLGIYQGEWHRGEAGPLFPSVGYFTADDFDPPRWKQNFPLVAFERLTGRDAYWAAKIVASFSDEQLRAVVETAEMSNPDAADYLARILMARRDKIVRAYFHRVAALDRFRVEGSTLAPVLTFEDMRTALSGNRRGSESFEYELRSERERGRVLHRGQVGSTRIPLPPSLLAAQNCSLEEEQNCGIVRLTIRRAGESHQVSVWLLYSPQGVRIAGVRHG